MNKVNLFLVASTLCLASCGTQSTDDTAKLSDTSNVPDSNKNITAATDDTFNYDAGKDGMLVAPQLTRKLGDSLGIKMYEVTAKPGDSIPLHSHPDHAFYVIDGGKAAIYFGSDRQEWELKPGMGFINGPVNDAAKNIGKTTLKFLVVDIYRSRVKAR